MDVEKCESRRLWVEHAAERQGWQRACAYLASLALAQATLGVGCGYLWQWAADSRHVEELRKNLTSVYDDNARMESKIRRSLLSELEVGPFETVAGVREHQLPPMYGKVKEKMIWSYWYDPEECPDSRHCVLPAAVELSRLSIEVNSGSFVHRLLHRDEVDQYISRYELPVRWADMPAPQQREALMFALLARYGGVALDLSVVLLRPLDIPWEFMLASNVTFQGYMYRINGEHWKRPESTAAFFMMSRREGILGAAVRSQIIGLGDLRDARDQCPGCEALGDHVLTPILSMYNYSLPKCAEDPTVQWHNGNKSNPRRTLHGRVLLRDVCPERQGPQWSQGISGPPRTDVSLIIRDPRDGPQLPMMFSGMELWNITDSDSNVSGESEEPLGDPGSPMYLAGCTSRKACWEDVFLKRHNGQQLRLVRLRESTTRRLSVDQILNLKDSYFYNWLKLAGVLEDEKRLNRSFGGRSSWTTAAV